MEGEKETTTAAALAPAPAAPAVPATITADASPPVAPSEPKTVQASGQQGQTIVPTHVQHQVEDAFSTAVKGVGQFLNNAGVKAPEPTQPNPPASSTERALPTPSMNASNQESQPPQGQTNQVGQKGEAIKKNFEDAFNTALRGIAQFLNSFKAPPPAASPAAEAAAAPPAAPQVDAIKTEAPHPVMQASSSDATLPVDQAESSQPLPALPDASIPVGGETVTAN